MSLAYKVDELLALRDSVSESAVSIEKFPNEDVIREHVLRPSASAAANLNSRSSNRSLRAPTAPALTPVGPQKRPSPSPSLKRGKAEKLLKEHGSPPGLRVTAGGRIVPSDLPPLGTSRYGDTVYRQQQPLRAAPGNAAMAMQNHPNSSNTARIEVVGGQPIVFVGDRMFALPAVNTTSSALPVNGVAAMDPAMKRGPEPPTPGIHGAMPGSFGGPSRSATHTPFAGLDLAALKAQQALKKQELRTVEQTEVLQANHQTEAWRAAMIEKKRCLIIELDALRKQISAVEMGVATSQPSPLPTTVSASVTPIPSFAVQNQPPFAPAMYPFPAANQFAPMPMYQPQPQPYGAFPSFPPVEPAAFVPNTVTPQAPHSPPGSANRRSCAIEIKPPPPEDGKKPSALNPKSPTYEPTAKSSAVQDPVPPTPSPGKSTPWLVQEASVPVKHEYGTSSRKHSLSSVDTTDFFPTNTHEHSSTRVAPQIKDTKEPAASTAAPTTPEKNWPASPWNEGQSSHSSKHDPTPKLTSWPEAFGKQPSQQSLRPSTANQSVSATSGQNSVVGATLTASLTASSRSSNTAAKTNSGQHSSAHQSWLLSEKPAAHVPSTYQEGYQAGYDHVGIPDTPDVLQGYIQGLLHFLTDESKKRQAEYQRHANSRTPSLRGLVAESLPHDPTFGTGINRNGLNSDQENVRLTKTSPSDDGRHNIGHNSQGHFKGTAGSYTMGHEVAQESQHRAASSAQYFKPPSLFPPRIASGPGQVVGSNSQKDGSKGMIHNQGTAFHGDLHSKGDIGQPFLGTQMQNRSQGTPLTMQRLYSTAKERGSHELGGYSRPPSRAFANLRLTGGLDGAMDDLAEMITDTHLDESGKSVPAEKRSPEAEVPVEYEESDASCFKSSNKGKQKAASSPAKTMDMETVASSRTNTPGSPKKAGEHSPAKAKLEQVTNKFRRGKKDESRTMSPEERTKRSEKWRQRFQQLKRMEMEEIEAYRRNNGT